jgi:hypothetical protein
VEDRKASEGPQDEAELIHQICRAWVDERYELQEVLEDRFYSICSDTGFDQLQDRLNETKCQFLATPPATNKTFFGVITEEGEYLVRVTGPLPRETAEWVRAELGLSEAGTVERLPPSPYAKKASPQGFAWGYGGSGPAALALSILYHVYGHEEALFPFYQDFKFQVLNHLDRFQGIEGKEKVGVRWQLTTEEIHRWMSRRVTTKTV